MCVFLFFFHGFKRRLDPLDILCMTWPCNDPITNLKTCNSNVTFMIPTSCSTLVQVCVWRVVAHPISVLHSPKVSLYSPMQCQVRVGSPDRQIYSSDNMIQRKLATQLVFTHSGKYLHSAELSTLIFSRHDVNTSTHDYFVTTWLIYQNRSYQCIYTLPQKYSLFLHVAIIIPKVASNLHRLISFSSAFSLLWQHTI